MRSPLVTLVVGPLAVGLLTLAACTSTPARLPLADARTRYAATVTAVANAVGRDQGVSWTVRDASTATSRSEADTCAYRSDVLVTPTYLGRAQPWAQVKATVDGALAGSGFEPATAVEGDPGGWLVLTSHDASGATLTLRAKGSSEVWIESVVSGSACR